MTALPKSFSLLLVPFLPFLLSACASLSKDQCIAADWRQIGYTDGLDGQRGSRIDEHAKACAEYGIRPHLDDYLDGRTRGLLNYCQAENGFVLGRHGSEQNGADCAPNQQGAFLEQYRRGRIIHDIESELSNRYSQMRDNDREINKKNRRIEEIKDALKNKDLAADKRTALLTEFDHLVEDKDKIGRSTRRLQNEADRSKLELEKTLREFGR